MLALPELQGQLAAAIRRGVADPGAGVALGDLLVKPGRLAIHRRHARNSLSDVLAAHFPAVRRLVGEGFFAFAAAQFVAAHPPRDPRVSRYGDEFPGHLAALSETASLPWLADVARIEVAMRRAALAPLARPLDHGSLGRVPPEAVAEGTIMFGRAVSMIHSSWPAADVWRAALADDAPEGLDLATLPPSRLVVCRIADQPRAIDLGAGDFLFWSALWRGETIGRAAELTFETDSTFDLAAALVTIFASEAVVELRTPQGKIDDQ